MVHDLPLIVHSANPATDEAGHIAAFWKQLATHLYGSRISSHFPEQPPTANRVTSYAKISWFGICSNDRFFKTHENQIR
jgi:hypothetical protein